MTRLTDVERETLEEWRWIDGYEGRYEVSSFGRVRSTPRPRTRGGVLTPSTHGKGYAFVTLRRGTTKRPVDIHRLVADAFVEGTGPVVRHLNGNSADNRAVNLAWGTRSENEIDKLRHGTNPERNKVECPAGHRYDEKNTIWYRGERRCRHCKRAADRRRRARLRAALAPDSEGATS